MREGVAVGAVAQARGLMEEVGIRGDVRDRGRWMGEGLGVCGRLTGRGTSLSMKSVSRFIILMATRSPVCLCSAFLTTE